MENKREANYTRWTDFYNNHYKIALDNLNNSLDTAPNDKIIELLKEVYIFSIKTLNLYLSNNGLFKQTSLDIIKECFYIDFIENGEDWIEIYEYFENTDTQFSDTVFIKKCLEAFKLLDKNFIGALEDDC